MWLLFLSLAVLANGFEQAQRKKKQIWIFHMKYALYTVELLMNYLHYKSYTFKAYIKTNKQFGRARDARIQTVTGWKIYGHLRAPWNAPGGSKYIKIHHSIAKIFTQMNRQISSNGMYPVRKFYKYFTPNLKLNWRRTVSCVNLG